jgi:TolB protein
MNADGSGAVTLGPGAWPSWSPDGTRIAFARINPAQYNPLLGQYASDIYVAAADGSDPTNLTGTTSAFTSYSAPAWSPDGTRIACWKMMPGGAFPVTVSALVIMRADGSGQSAMVGDGVVHSTPVWSPDARTVAFSHRTGSGAAVRTVDLAGGGTSSLTPGDAWDIPTSWR